MRLLALFVGWLLGLVFLSLAVAALFHSVATAAPLLLAAMLLLPPIRHRIYLATKRTISRKARLISLAVLTFAALALFGMELSRREEAASAIELQNRIAEFHLHKHTLIDSLSGLVSRSDFEAAIVLIDRYSFAEDSTLLTLRDEVSQKVQAKLKIERRDQILAELRGVPVSEFARNKRLYGELLELYPDDATYREKHRMYSTKLSEKQDQERKAAERRAREAEEKAARTKRIESQFSAWDGAHRNLTRLIKASMNDPGSYKHDETVYWDMGDHLVVRTSFRGKNAFGGVVRNWVKAEVDLDGNIIAILEQGP